MKVINFLGEEEWLVVESSREEFHLARTLFTCSACSTLYGASEMQHSKHVMSVDVARMLQ